MNVTSQKDYVPYLYIYQLGGTYIMKGLRNLLLEEQFRLENIIKETKTRLEQAPEGRLRLSKSHNQVQYYCCTEFDDTPNLEYHKTLCNEHTGILGIVFD
jgi:hypothetical protein